MLILFDCDGVLVDSEIIAAEVDAELFSHAGYDIEAADLVQRFAGYALPNIVAEIEEETGKQMPEDFVERARLMTDERLAADLVAIDGVHRVLENLAHDRCICSNSGSARLDLMLNKTDLVGHFYPNIFSARDVREGKVKPDPDVYLHGAEMFGAEPADVLVVEDSMTGVTAAVDAGMRVIGFTGGAHSWPGHSEQLMEAGTITTINRFTDLPATIEALSNWSPENL